MSPVYSVNHVSGRSEELGRPGRVMILAVPEADGRIVGDLIHAIRTPLAIAARRLARALREPAVSEDIRAAHAAVQKCVRAIENAQVFSQLAKDSEIPSKTSSIAADRLVQLLREIATDYAAMYGDSIPVRLDVPEHLDATVRADQNLYELAVANVIDNACKFSYRGTEVTIRVTVTPSEFRIDVLNEGIPVQREDLKQIFKRGWSRRDSTSRDIFRQWLGALDCRRRDSRARWSDWRDTD